LVLDLEASPSWREVRLVDSRLDTSRQIRAATRRLPVLPDVASALVAAGVMPV
jgi:hypothetical protein